LRLDEPLRPLDEDARVRLPEERLLPFDERLLPDDERLLALLARLPLPDERLLPDEERPLLPDEWRAASTFSDWGLVLTPARAKQLVEKVSELVSSWDEEEDVEGADQFVVAMTAYPRPGRLVRDPEDRS
jgi:hypothetical protein